jgi:DNA-binding IclR family transcriptional regulator
MRGFSPTLQQAERLFHLPEEVCRTMLARLVEEGFLRMEHDGRFRLLRHG